MTSLYTVQGWVSLDMPASLLRPDTSNSKSFDQQWRSCDAWPTDTEDSPKVQLYRSKGRMIVTAIIAPTAWSWWWCSTSATQRRAKWAVHSRAAATVTARSSMVKLYLVIDFVLQIRCLWAGLSHLHQWKQAHSFISGPREVTSTLSNESCFDS